jgi:hypothetical protein
VVKREHHGPSTRRFLGAEMSTRDGLYRPPMFWRLLPAWIGLFVGYGLIALAVSVFSGGPWWFFVFFLAVVGWMAFNGLYRTSYELEFDNAYLYWRGFLRSGKVPIADVVGVDSEFLGSLVVFTFRDGRRVRVVVLQGFAPFITALTKAHPSIGAAPGGYARLVERAQLRWKRAGTASRDSTGATDDSER